MIFSYRDKDLGFEVVLIHFFYLTHILQKKEIVRSQMPPKALEFELFPVRYRVVVLEIIQPSLLKL